MKIIQLIYVRNSGVVRTLHRRTNSTHRTAGLSEYFTGEQIIHTRTKRTQNRQYIGVLSVIHGRMNSEHRTHNTEDNKYYTEEQKIQRRTNTKEELSE